MKTKTVSKIATTLTVLLLVLSGVMVMQLSARAEESEDGMIVGRIQADNGTTTIRPKGVSVKLMDVSQRDISMDDLRDVRTSSGGYFKFDNLDEGYYKVIIPSQSNMVSEKVFFENQTGVEELGEGEKLDLGHIDISYENLEHKITGNVTDEDGEAISNATVEIQDLGNDYNQEAEIIDPENGTYELYAYEGEFIIKSYAENYMTNATKMTIADNIDQDIILGKTPVSPTVSGFMYDAENDVGIESKIDVTLYDVENETLIHETIESGPYYEVTAVDGDYTIVVNPEGYEPMITQEVIDGSKELDYYYKVNHTESYGDESVDIEIDFADEDWSNLTVTTEREILPNTVFEGLGYSYLGNYRMQIDMAFGDGNLTLEQTEIDAFQEWMEYREARTKTTKDLISLDGDYFEFDGLVKTPDLSNISAGDTTETPSRFNITSEVDYQSNDVELDQDEYDMDLKLKDDNVVENLRDYSYKIILREGYERINTPAGIEIEGYTTLDIDPEEGEGYTPVNLDIRKFEVGEVTLNIEAKIYQKEDRTYVVKEGSEIEASASYTSPSGKEGEVNYSWELDDEPLNKYTKTITQPFDTEGEYNLSIEVTETSGLTNETWVNIIVDGTGPTGDIDADNTTIDEGQTIDFSASSFEGPTPIPNDGYEWNFSDGSEIEIGENVTHRFDLKGEYPVKLNVTDSIGNYNSEEITITVEDITDPVAKFTANYSGEEIESENLTKINIERDQTLRLNANRSYDPAGYEGDQGPINSATWWLEEEKDKRTGTETEFTFDEVTSYTLYLNVTDEAGNYHNLSTPIEVTPGPTPNLEIANFTVSRSKPTANDGITVEIKVSNYGSADAEDVLVTFKVDGKEKSVTPEFYEDEETEGNATIETGGSKIIRFDYKPSDEGEETLTVNVTDSQEPSAWHYDNQENLTINVQPPAWRENIALILIPVIIIGVSVALYYYKEKIFGE